MAENDTKKMTEEILKFGDVKIEKMKKIDVNDVDIAKILASSEFVYGKKNRRNRCKMFHRIKN